MANNDASALKKLLGSISIDTHLVSALSLRILLIFYSLFHDQVFELKYTDIDYSVFTDGSRYLLQGRSPFLRHGYRYTPLFAYLTLGNLLIARFVGKLIFTCFDVLTGLLIYKILREFKINIREKPSKFATCLWLYNPLPLIICTRGSSDSVVTFFVLYTILTLIQKRYFISGLSYGFVIHCKLYPIIYAPALYLYLSGSNTKSIFSLNAILPLKAKKFKFVISSLFSFLFITYLSYVKFGQLYLEEAWIYHFSRQDFAHNFSPYFYLYQLSNNAIYIKTLGYLSFFPQLFAIIYLTISFTVKSNQFKQYRIQNLLFALFTISFVFVSLNKVCTSQYFLWYLSLLPLSAPYIQLASDKTIKLFLIWLFGQAIWLFFAYLYEFLLLDILFMVWFASILFLVINLFIINKLIRSFRVGSDNKIEQK